MIRRIHVARLEPGELTLDEAAAHHARDVLRLPDGAEVEVFDDAGAIAFATFVHRDARGAAVRVAGIQAAPAHARRWSVAAAVPKGERADWMVEKLSELGTDAFIPLKAVRSVVLPEGKNKQERWARISSESAKQSRRPGVMRIESLTPVADAIHDAATAGTAWYLCTSSSAAPISELAREWDPKLLLTLFVGPEGGWTDEEIALFEEAHFAAASLTTTILRVETAAIAAAAIIGSLRRS